MSSGICSMSSLLKSSSSAVAGLAFILSLSFSVSWFLLLPLVPASGSVVALSGTTAAAGLPSVALALTVTSPSRFSLGTSASLERSEYNFM